LRSDQTIALLTQNSLNAYPDRQRRVSYRGPQTHRYRVFLANRFDLPALAIAENLSRPRAVRIVLFIRKYPDGD